MSNSAASVSRISRLMLVGVFAACGGAAGASGSEFTVDSSLHPLSAVAPSETSELPPGSHETWIFEGSYNDVGTAIVPTADGGVLMAVRAMEFTDPNLPEAEIKITKLDPSGAVVWEHPLAIGLEVRIVAAELDADGMLVVAGFTDVVLPACLDPCQVGAESSFVLKFNPETRTALWSRLLPFETIGFPRSMAITSGGAIFVTGAGADSSVAGLTSEGEILWVRQFDLGGTEDPFDIEDCGDALFVSGSVGGEYWTEQSRFLVRIDIDGNLDPSWILAPFDQPYDRGFGLACSDGNLFHLWVRAESYDTERVLFLDRFDPHSTTPEPIFSVRVTPPGQTLEGYARLAAEPSGNVVVGAEVPGWMSNDLLVTRFSPDGTGIWEDVLGTDDYDILSDIEVGPSGDIFLYGSFMDGMGGVLMVTKIAGSAEALPAAPLNFRATRMGSARIDLAWSVEEGSVVRGFRVERVLSAAGPFQEIAQLDGSARSFSDPGLAAGTVYFYRIRSLNWTGLSVYAPVVRARTPKPGPSPLIPTIDPGLRP